jgi:hypothetical protein
MKGPKPISPIVRFLSKVQITDTCWLWTGALSHGYGRFGINHGEIVYAHRFAYELWIGPIPIDREVDHLCHNADQSCKGGSPCCHRRCVNPEHLEPTTSQVNQSRSPHTLGSKNAAKIYCPQGHAYGHKPYRDLGGMRHCRECNKERQRIRRKALVDARRATQ